MNQITIAIGSALATLVIIFIFAKLGYICSFGCECKKETYDGPSLSFDPSSRDSTAGIGPIDLRTYSVSTKIPNRTEGFCQSCM